MTVLQPVDVVKSGTLQSGKSPVSFTMASDKQVSETTNLVELAPPEVLTDAENVENPFISVQNKSPKGEVSPPENRPHEKLGLFKSMNEPVEDDLVTTCIVNQKASSENSHSGSFFITPAEDDQECKNEKRKESEDTRNSLIKQKPQINAPQSSKPDTNLNNIYSEIGSDFTNPLICGESPSALSCTSPGKEANGRLHSESFKSSMPIEEQVCEPKRLSATEFPGALALAYNTDKRKSDVLSQTTTQQKKKPLPKYPSCKKIKTIPVPTADDLFTPDIISRQSHPRVPDDVTRTKDGRHPFSKDKKKRKEKKSTVNLTIQHQSHSSQSRTDAPRKPKTSCPSKSTGQSKETKKQRFALYGSNRNKIVLHECSSKSKLSTAPVYITVLDGSEKAPRYTDRVSAKQKVYSQWSSTFVAPKTKNSSHKKRQKNCKELLESRMETLRNCIKDRLALKEKQVQNGSKNKC
ncbi:hypothetical protein Baya_0225 [Bagarius yarrelli]|uniref:Uncharacterized protein n=1 Tax=Bagarius yarrelli TaxID=175774 RepID=A0A556THM3_BAGYA|nr:hypothetical protein Baya_0225 [Bagarius yarrelli]